MRSSLITHLLSLGLVFPTTLAFGVPISVSPGINITFSPPKNCSDITTGILPKCYAALNETSYLNAWNTTQRLESCAPDQLWSTCFMNAAYASPAVVNTTATNTPQTTKSTTNTPTNKPPPPLIPLQHDCSNLTPQNPNTTTLAACPFPLASTTTPPNLFYALYAIFAINHHLSAWALALNATTTRPLINATTTNNTQISATTLLISLITHYGVDTAADAKLIALLNVPSKSPIPDLTATGPTSSTDGGRVPVAQPNPLPPADSTTTTPITIPGRTDPRTGTQPPRKKKRIAQAAPLPPQEYQALMVLRLAEVLRGVMGGFATFLGTVQGGAFETYNLSSVGGLEGRLGVKGGKDGRFWGGGVSMAGGD